MFMYVTLLLQRRFGPIRLSLTICTRLDPENMRDFRMTISLCRIRITQLLQSPIDMLCRASHDDKLRSVKNL